jgi:hypothetical protein
MSSLGAKKWSRRSEVLVVVKLELSHGYKSDYFLSF